MLMTWDGVVRFSIESQQGNKHRIWWGVFCRDPLLCGSRGWQKDNEGFNPKGPLAPPSCSRSSLNIWSWKKWQTSWVPQEIASALLILTRLVTENESSSYLGQTAKFVDTECQEAFLSTWYSLVLFVFKFKAILASDLWYFLPFPLSVGSDLFSLRSTSK